MLLPGSRREGGKEGKEQGLEDGKKGEKEVKFTLEQATNTHRGSRGITLLFLQPRR
jgi:hypothetical protein